MNDPEEQFVCPQCGTTVYEADKVCPKCGTLLDWSVDLNDAAAIAKPGMNEPYVAPMSLGDIFDRTFRLFGRVFSRSIIIVLILYIPISILLVKGAQEFYATIGEITARGQGAAPGSDEILTMVGWMGLFGISVLLAFLASLCGELAVTNLVRSEFTGSSMTWKGAFMEGIGIRFLRAAGVVRRVELGQVRLHRLVDRNLALLEELENGGGRHEDLRQRRQIEDRVFSHRFSR